MIFEDKEITLDIPKEGVVFESGWTITPHTHPGVSLHYTTTGVLVLSTGIKSNSFVSWNGPSSDISSVHAR